MPCIALIVLSRALQCDSMKTILRHLVPVSKQPNQIVVHVAPNIIVKELRRRK